MIKFMFLSKVIIVIGVVLFFCAGFSSANDNKVWKQEDCKKISDASGHFLVVSGYLLEESGKKKEEGDLKEMEKSFMGAVHFSEMAANYAKTYQVFCQSKQENNKDD
ncbi:MAG: hypothetical protein EBT88_10300 [Proteobacteria bacterium]|nr:hypothetical protein [Pseudomonadota bacterium]|tara:strand:- start:149 stop:469 length:321 start_codon:yes stop_codon:yes gene_type:complete